MGISVNDRNRADTTRSQLVGSHIGILGGMFDPVHLGHLQAAKTALQELSLDQVLLMPCSRPVHRESALASNKDRIAMLEAAVADTSGLSVDDRECRRADLSYTYDSLAEIRKESPDDLLYLLMGSDTFSTLESWYRWQEILELCHIVLVSRPGFEPELSPVLEELVEFNATDSVNEIRAKASGYIFTGLRSEVDLSSTKIREALASHQPLDGLVTASVADYIIKHSLYQS